MIFGMYSLCLFSDRATGPEAPAKLAPHSKSIESTAPRSNVEAKGF